MAKGSATVLNQCQSCRSGGLESVLFLGYVPPVNQMVSVGSRPTVEEMYPLELMYCEACHLVQIGCQIDPPLLFPPEYPYTSGSTRILVENFSDLFRVCSERFGLSKESFVVDVGSNDGTLLTPFRDGGCRVLGIEPTDNADTARARGIETEKRFFGESTARDVAARYGRADFVTATNVFAHMPEVEEKVRAVLVLLSNRGVFVSESHYLLDLIETLQFDTVYHEHLRYYSIHSQKFLLEAQGLEVFHVERIPTHGGSIRVFAARSGTYETDPSVGWMMEAEVEAGLLKVETYRNFAARVVEAKLSLLHLIREIKQDGKRVFGVGAPSRASTLITYAGLDHHMVESILEIPGSHKVGKYMPGTLIPVEEESVLFGPDQPDYALLFSWHIGNELMGKVSEKGYRGDFIMPLPEPQVVKNPKK